MPYKNKDTNRAYQSEWKRRRNLNDPDRAALDAEVHKLRLAFARAFSRQKKRNPKGSRSEYHARHRDRDNESNARCRFIRDYPEIPGWLLEARVMAWRFRRMSRGDFGFDGLGVS